VVLWNNFLRKENVDVTDETRSIVREVFELENESNESSSSEQDDSSRTGPTKKDIEERDQIIKYIEKYEPFIKKAMRDSQKVEDDNLIEGPEKCVNRIDRAIEAMEEFYSEFEQGEQKGNVDPDKLRRFGQNKAEPRVVEAYYILLWLNGKKEKYYKLADEDDNTNLGGVYQYLFAIENYCLSRFKRELAKYGKDDVQAAQDLGYSLLIDAFNSERFEDHHKQRLKVLIGDELDEISFKADVEMD
jgi:hypothetical protein